MLTQQLCQCEIHTLLRQMSTAGSFNLTVALPSSTNFVKNFSMLSFSCNRNTSAVTDGKIQRVSQHYIKSVSFLQQRINPSETSRDRNCLSIG